MILLKNYPYVNISTKVINFSPIYSIMSKKNIRLAVLMDPLHKINIKKDSTYAMLKEASKKNWDIFVFDNHNLYFKNNNYLAKAHSFEFNHSFEPNWYSINNTQEINLLEFDIILFRKDPPVDLEYLYATYILEQVAKKGVLVANNPKSIRDCNEKLFATEFPEFSPPTLVTQDISLIKEFQKEYQEIIIKPLDSMGGNSIFKLTPNDTNINVILESATIRGTKTIMAQKFIPEIKDGDKRILMINGEPVHYGIKRIPDAHDHRGNLAANAKSEGFRINDHEHEICHKIGPRLKELGLNFVGLDVIGPYVTEINVTCPTCIQEIDSYYSLNIAKTYLEELERLL